MREQNISIKATTQSIALETGACTYGMHSMFQLIHRRV